MPKNYAKAILICLVLLFFGCPLEDDFDMAPYPFWGEIEAQLNDELWQPRIYGTVRTNNNTMAIRMRSFSSEGFLREYMYINNIPKEVGSYNISKVNTASGVLGSTYSTFLDDGDVREGRWNVSETDSTSFIEITSLDIESGEVMGNFEVTYIISPTDKERFDAVQYPYPDTINIIDAVFYTKI